MPADPSGPSIFPFGAPSTPRPPRRPRGSAKAFVLGVYPSALHARWSRSGRTFVAALAVADEPEVFWTGDDGQDRISSWSHVRWNEDWGSVSSPPTNGSSGRDVRDRVLAPLGIAIEDAWLTDSVNTFFVKSGPGSQRSAIEQRYLPFAKKHRLETPTIPRRPSASALVDLAIRSHADRLRSELLEARAPLVISLGNEALSVLHAVATCEGLPTRLSIKDYGREGRVRLQDYSAHVYAMVHPGQRSPSWRGAHDRWIRRVTGH